MELKKYVMAVAASMGCAAFGAYLYSRYEMATEKTYSQVEQRPFETGIAHYTAANYAPTDFTEAAEKSVNAVVHVKIMKENNYNYDMQNDFFRFFFGQPQQRNNRRQNDEFLEAGSGSGVIISPDGYIITNNHVVDGADKIQVILNDRTEYVATVVGTDPQTDIALMKIEATDLQYLTFGNSDAVKVGEWVLAVGNPFNLTSTVTAGIISAKSRNIGIMKDIVGIESFIQTDAAVNPGNSGGALVNTHGELIGINTAIASNTGSYTGFAFAVPAALAMKIVQDLKQYGEAQRALLGVNIVEVTPQVQKEYGLSSTKGIYVAGLTDNGAAKDGGIQEGDVIMAIDGEEVNTVPELKEKIGTKRPGEKIKVSVERDGKLIVKEVTLKNIKGTTSVVTSVADSKTLGAQLEKISDKERSKYGIRSGLKVKKLEDGKLKEAGVKEGFIIVKANRMPVNSVEDFQQIVATSSEGLFIAGIYPNGRQVYYAINLEE